MITWIMLIKKMQFYDLKHKLINDHRFFQEFLEEITVNVTRCSAIHLHKQKLP